MDEVAIPRLMVAGVSGSVGKTTVTVALIAALREMGLEVACFKCGPDYLDPTYHGRAAGRTPHNLDPWMMGEGGVAHTLVRESAGADLVLIEGMMGLYDGIAPQSDEGSSAQLARMTATPVLLVADAGAMARSISALALGFRQYDPELNLVGLLCNQIGGRGHLELLRRAEPALQIIGGLPLSPDHAFTERHLGLEAARAGNLPGEDLAFWARAARENIDLERLLELARRAPALAGSAVEREPVPVPLCRIGVARDRAFSFYYPENLRLLEQAGADLIEFSPLEDSTLPRVDGVYLGGGYPELYAEALSQNTGMLQSLRAFAAAGGPVHGECGGLMYLCRALVTTEGKRWPMAGLVPGSAVMHEGLQAIGYTSVTTLEDTPLGPAGTGFRGHQFRYSHLDWEESRPPAFQLSSPFHDQSTRAGFAAGNVVASYVHAHWASNPQIPHNLVSSCRARP